MAAHQSAFHGFAGALAFSWILISSAAPADAIGPTERAEVLDHVREIVETRLAIPEKRAAILDALKEGERAGRYATDDDGSFTLRVTRDLRAASEDGHLYLAYDPAMEAGLLKDTKKEDDYPSAQPEIAARFARRNQGYAGQRILEGNVRYLDLESFDWSPTATPQVVDAAARFLGGGDAIIVDLRHNAGGSPTAAVYLLSYFAQPDEFIVTFQSATTSRDIRAVHALPASRITGKRVYVLTSAETASAAEEFAYYITTRKLGETVGETTSGAGNEKTDFPAGHGFVVSAPTARAIDGVTKSNWEGVGVAPTVKTELTDALETAHVRALEEMLGDASSPERHATALALRKARARLHPVVLTASDLERYSGIYGDRRIVVESGRLIGRIPKMPDIRLMPLGGDWFALDGTDRQVHFNVQGGHATSLQMSRPEMDGKPLPLTGLQ